MDGIEMITRIKEIIGFVKEGDIDKVILYLKYMIEDIKVCTNKTESNQNNYFIGMLLGYLGKKHRKNT